MYPRISSDVIELEVSVGVPVTIEHGFGRQLAGWLVIWTDAVVSFYVSDSAADSSQQLTLIPTATASVRLVLL